MESSATCRSEKRPGPPGLSAQLSTKPSPGSSHARSTYRARWFGSSETSHEPHSSGQVLHVSGNEHSPSALQPPTGGGGGSPVSDGSVSSALVSAPSSSSVASSPSSSSASSSLPSAAVAS